MNNVDLRNAISGINKAFIAESDDLDLIAADFRNEKSRKVRLAALTLCIVFAGAGAAGLFQSGLLTKNTPSSEENPISVSSDAQAVSSSGPEPEVTTPAATTPDESSSPDEDEPLYYSDLVGSTEAPKLEGYSADASFDIIAFDEGMLKDSAAVIEGEVLDIWVNQYEYTTASDKFEPGGVLYHKPTSVSYKIKINKVYSGDFNAGDEVTVEDFSFVCDSIVSIKKGSSYVIPIGKGDGRFYESDKILGGDKGLKSCYFTLYQFHPQIERVSGGYVVPGDWESVSAGCKEVIIDTEHTDLPYSQPLYFVPEDEFADRMSRLLQNR